MRWGEGSFEIQRLKIIFILGLVGITDGYLNLFISQSQVLKLLGEYDLFFCLLLTVC